ncbi:hypothetical protein TNCV_4608741 [Trichonephila clavipes]|nr:hypothetical protein TNCV_4608741 [Trichonephila clavipes]
MIATKFKNKVLLSWVGGEFTPGYCISFDNVKAIGKLRGILSLIGKDISLLNAKDVYVCWYPLKCAGSLVCDYFVYKENYIRWSVENCPSGSSESQIWNTVEYHCSCPAVVVVQNSFNSNKLARKV